VSPRRTGDDENGPPRAPLRDLLRRRGFWGLAIFLLVLGPLVSLVAFLPDVYRSAAIVLIERQQIPDELVKSTVTSGLEVRLQTISQEILSRSNLERVIAQFSLYQDLIKSKTPMELVIEQMRKDVKIELTGGRGERSTTVAFTISFRGRDPQKVALVANTLAGSYINKNLELREGQAKGTAEFLSTQLAQWGQKLQDQEKQVGAFKERHMGELPEQTEANLKTLEQLTTQLRLNADNMTRATERKAAIERQLAEALGVSTPSGPDALALRLAQARQQLAALQTRYSDKHPDIIRLKTEIQTLEAQSGGGEGGGSAFAAIPVTPAIQQLKNALLEADVQLKGLESEGSGLRRSINVYQARLEAAPRTQQEYAALSREYETTKEMYKSLTVRQSESALSESMETRQKGEQFRVIEPALPSEEPAAPKRPRLLAVALALALAAAAAAILGPEALDRSVHSIDQLQARCSLPVLVGIPRILGQAEAQRERMRLALVASAVVLGAIGLCAGSYFVARENSALTALLIR
jgi:polysaccharide biosynthesis transport protein